MCHEWLLRRWSFTCRWCWKNRHLWVRSDLNVIECILEPLPYPVSNVYINMASLFFYDPENIAPKCSSLARIVDVIYKISILSKESNEKYLQGLGMYSSSGKHILYIVFHRCSSDLFLSRGFKRFFCSFVRPSNGRRSCTSHGRRFLRCASRSSSVLKRR
jgi:hypothetical protein